MVKNGKTALLASLLIPGVALAQINVGDKLGASETAIRAALEARGFTATEIEIEHGEIEVEATSGGQSFEFEVSPKTGLVLAAYEDDDEDGDEDDEDGDEDDEDDEDDDANDDEGAEIDD